MPDGATSTDPAVQAQLDRLFAHGPGTDTLGLDRITRLLARLGDPHRHLPPVFHVAGTNGKGSTCAFLRAALEAAGHRVHVYTSPHLVRFNERIRLAGKLIDDAMLAPLLAEVLDQAEDLRASFFEVTTAAAFLAFARTSADACVVEVGLGGRLDATNVIPAPLVCGIAALGIDHQAFLGDTVQEIAGEKVGIAKRGVPLVTMEYNPSVSSVLADKARAIGAPLVRCGSEWSYGIDRGRLRYADGRNDFVLPAPELMGSFQLENLALATAMMRHQNLIEVPHTALSAASSRARWPARMQRLKSGPMTRLVARTPKVYVDGAHNWNAATALRSAWQPRDAAERVALVIGMLDNKDAASVLGVLATPPGWCRIVGVPVPGHAHHAPEYLVLLARAGGFHGATSASSLEEGLKLLDDTDPPDRILIAGSLYLAGEALRLNDELPD